MSTARSPRPRRPRPTRPGSTTSAWSPPRTMRKPAPARRSTSPGCPCCRRPARRTAVTSRAPWAAHFGLARTPFGKAIAAGVLFARQAHAQATARISFCIDQILLGVITGDVGAGKTVAVRAAVAGLDPTRHQVIYVANPAFGTRGLYVQVVRALGAQHRMSQSRADGPGRGPACRRDRRTAPHRRAHRRLFRPAQLASATSGEPLSGGVTALLT